MLYTKKNPMRKFRTKTIKHANLSFAKAELCLWLNLIVAIHDKYGPAVQKFKTINRMQEPAGLFSIIKFKKK